MRLNHRVIHLTLENFPYGKFSNVWLKTIEENGGRTDPALILRQKIRKNTPGSIPGRRSRPI